MDVVGAHAGRRRSPFLARPVHFRNFICAFSGRALAYPGGDMRLLWLMVGLALLLLIPFFIWGRSLDEAFSTKNAAAWLQNFGPWAWAAGLLLLVSDLFLPIPGTAVMAALGFVYGPFWGGLLGAAGSFCGGALAYGLCRGLGRRIAVQLVGEQDLARGSGSSRTRAAGWWRGRAGCRCCRR